MDKTVKIKLLFICNRPELRIWKTECGHAECSSAERADRQPNGPAPTSPFWVGYLFYLFIFYLFIFLRVHPVCGLFFYLCSVPGQNFILILFFFFFYFCSFAADFPEAQRRSHHCHRRRERSNRLHGGRRPSRSCHHLGVGYTKNHFLSFFTFLFHPFSLQDSWNNHLIKNDTHFPWLSFALSP